MANFYTSFLASVLLFLTPKSLTNQIARYIPGTPEYSEEQQAYARKVRDVTARRVEQFASIFHALSESFRKKEPVYSNDKQKEVDYFLSNIAEATCQRCFKKEHCWSHNLDTTYDKMAAIMTEMKETNGQISGRTIRGWNRYCVRSEKVIDSFYKEFHFYQANQKLKEQIHESRKLVAEHLKGVSEVMTDFAKEIQKERENHEKQEEQLLQALYSFGLEVEHIEIYSLQQGNIDIDISIPYCDGMDNVKINSPFIIRYFRRNNNCI